MRSAIVGVVALFSLGCNLTGPKEDLSGYWLARVLGPATSDQYELTLRHSGDTVIGVACAKSFDTLLYKDAPVFGEYPHLSFAVVAYGIRFSGRQDGTKDIVGTYIVNSYQVDLRFKRSATPICN